MCSNLFISCRLLLIIIPTAFSAIVDDNTGDHYINQTCESISASASNYKANVIEVVNDLVANTSLHNGFMTASSKLSNNESDAAYGHALCRHDVSPEDCKNCLIRVSRTIMSSCSDQKATIWDDHCLLAYSNTQDNNQGKYPTYYKVNESDPSVYGETFRDTTLGLFYKLVGEVASQADTMFANGNATYGNETVYAMVQCTRDQSVEECTTCLALYTSSELNVCLPRKGGRVFSEVCIARYEMFPFLK